MFTWDAQPVAFHLFSAPIRFYSLFFTGALLTCYLGLSYLQNKFAKDLFSVDAFTLGALAFFFFGIRLFHLVFYQWHDFIENPLLVFDFSRGGLASHGALFMLVLYCFLFARWKKLSFLHLCDLLAVFCGFGAASVRIGNFFNSEIIGRVTDVPWAVIFSKIDSQPRHPTQIYEAVLLCATSALMLWGTHRKNWLDIRGRNMSIFLTVYFGGRFLLEQTKELQVPEAETLLTMGQWLSIIPFLVGLALLIRTKYTQR